MAPNTVRRAFGLGQGQQIPNKLLMRQDEDTDNEPMNTEMDDCQEAQRQTEDDMDMSEINRDS